MALHLVITELRYDEVAVVSLNGWLVGDEQDAQFRNCIDGLVRQGITKIVADLHDVTLLDSGGVGVLVAKLLTVRRRGGDLRLTRLTSRTERVLSTSRLLTIFATFDSPVDAIQSFATDVPPAAASHT
jgi:anti-sigma B factor antagonist